MSDVVKAERNNGILEIILNRPDSLNAMNEALIEGLLQRVEEAHAAEVRAVLIRGEGRGFCAGGDIRQFARLLESGQPIPREMPDRLHEIIEHLRELPKPVLAAVHGPCAGAGFSLVLACDQAIASEESKFNLAYVGIGLSPDGSSSFFLPRHVGMKKATEIFFTGKNMSAQEVLELGLINRVVPAADLLEQGRAMARMLASGPTAAYARVKQLINSSYENNLHDQLALEAHHICECSTSEDFRAGIEAFLAKKTPQFKGR
ncbi:MAG: enoyl-CoA hydratase/isomerase family protein [Acidobacteriota bacterium]